jgi:hypothetical protein
MKTSRHSRLLSTLLWIGAAALFAVSACVSYVILVVGGR